MKTAILRAPSPSLANCELTHIERRPIDAALAAVQHAALAEILAKCNYTVITLPALEGLPDSVFVEDTALILPEAAISLPLGTGSRTKEAELMLEHLPKLASEVRSIRPPAKMEGGDILRIGKKLFAGISSRTDAVGAKALSELSGEWGYEVVPVKVTGSLHLKTAVTAPDDETVLLNPEWVSRDQFKGLRVIEVDPAEPFAGNILRLGGRVAANAGFPRTIARLREAGFEVIETDISEFQKAEAGLTCLCLLSEG